MAETLKLDEPTQLDFDRDMVEQAYDRWAPIYDLVFGGVFSKGRRAAILADSRLVEIRSPRECSIGHRAEFAKPS